MTSRWINPAIFDAVFWDVGLPVSVCVALACVIFVSARRYRLRRAHAGIVWKPVPAFVVRSDLVAGRQPVIEYRYEYAGEHFRSSRLHFADERWTAGGKRSFARKWVALHPKGSPVTAYVDQQNPHVAVLIPQFMSDGVANLLTLFSVFGLCNALSVAFYLYKVMAP